MRYQLPFLFSGLKRFVSRGSSGQKKNYLRGSTMKKWLKNTTLKSIKFTSFMDTTSVFIGLWFNDINSLMRP
jgi:hypothetical protein